MTADEIKAAAAASLVGSINSQNLGGTAKVADVPPAPAPLTNEQIIEQLQAQNAMLLAALQKKDAAVAETVVVGSKTYHSADPFVTIHVMRKPGYCEPIQFYGGKLITEDPSVIKYLEDAIESGNGCYSHAPASKKTGEQLRMEADLSAEAAKHHNRMVKAGESTA